ncbi:MAG TPA: hypothetical protein VFN99_08660 [Gaiella sp.]|nr:hypothetical protein [Gaiella sp.]
MRDAVVCNPGNSEATERSDMFEELTEELLDLRAGVRGHGVALYAAVDDESCSSSTGCCSVILCCTCSWLCW